MSVVKAIVINPKDNVATAVDEIQPKSKVHVKIGNRELEVETKDKIPFGHKFAIRKILKEKKIIKYGEIIGIATENIDVGEYVHIHNIKSIYV